MIAASPVALHFSGHGVENSYEFLGSESSLNQNKGNLLLLEDENGKAQFLFSEDLKRIISESHDWSAEVVYVSSCYS